ncbi:TRAP transporter small permease subunit [Vibrio mangrovi]|uniref:TRAP transporter small permease protein n=1 Tax=Vibrio mangrovi TaxID=474394 RepID=A0A1Y6IZ68_9VIBR|nr:TRAP transporter small permease [Vibrio mangrovi]MDW6005321.1 TRAP transporter small permease [Vibrio mangrovi]SMS02947.1 Tripartite ATP-independent periplasmic transporters, DctQ component [Vibrio mangrovi]
MNLLIRTSQWINKISLGIAAFLIIYILCHILLEIVLRLFGMSTYVLDEFVGYAVATMTFLALGYSLEQGSLIRVNAIIDRIPERKRWLLDFVTSAIAAVFFSWVGFIWWTTVSRNFIRGTTSQSLAATPLWIPQGLVLIGIFVLCLTLIARSISLFMYHKPNSYGER